MASIPFSRVLFSAFEQALSADLTRMGALSSRELQDYVGAMSTRDTLYDQDTIPIVHPGPLTTSRLIPGCSTLPRFLTNGSDLTVSVSVGQGFAPGTPASIDESIYSVVRWAGTILTLVPDTVNPRMNLVVARPGIAQSNPVSRNILIDPVTRTVAVQTVYKTQDPTGTIIMLTGTPAALGTVGSAPLPPSPGADDLVLAEILIPANAANSNACNVIRRSNRLVVGPLANYHGLLQGNIVWSGSSDESVSDARPIGEFPMRAIIDGELVETSDPTIAVPDNVGGQSPFGSAAPATTDRPYYVYLCGGRNKPQWTGAGVSPLALVCSTVAPDEFGRPTVAIGTPRGTTIAGALYVGVGFVIMNTTRGKRIQWDGDWVYARSGGTALLTGVERPVVFNQPSFQLVSPDGTHNFDLPTLPAVSTRAKCALAINSALADPGVVDALCVSVHRNGGGVQQMVAGVSTPVSNRYGRGMVEFSVDPVGSSPLLTVSAATNLDPTAIEMRVMVAAVAYNMKVPRLSP
jgi:hypothetical protein